MRCGSREPPRAGPRSDTRRSIQPAPRCRPLVASPRGNPASGTLKTRTSADQDGTCPLRRRRWHLPAKACTDTARSASRRRCRREGCAMRSRQVRCCFDATSCGPSCGATGPTLGILCNHRVFVHAQLARGPPRSSPRHSRSRRPTVGCCPRAPRCARTRRPWSLRAPRTCPRAPPRTVNRCSCGSSRVSTPWAPSSSHGSPSSPRCQPQSPSRSTWGAAGPEHARCPGAPRTSRKVCPSHARPHRSPVQSADRPCHECPCMS